MQFTALLAAIREVIERCNSKVLIIILTIIALWFLSGKEFLVVWNKGDDDGPIRVTIEKEKEEKKTYFRNLRPGIKGPP